MLESHHGYYLYHYVPSIVAAVIFAVLFFLITTAHTWRMSKKRTFFCIPFILGGIFEFVGYCARCASHFNTASLNPYIIQSLLILVAPALFAATIYMTLGRIIIAAGGERFSIIRLTWLTKLFVIGDIFSFFVQGGGAGLMVRGSSLNLGQDIILVGLVIQIVMFAFFITIGVVFGARMKAYEGTDSTKSDAHWRKSLNMLFTVSALILARNLFRVIEYAMGQTGYLLAHEWSLYIFDSLLMLAVMFILFVLYPSFAKPEGNGSVQELGEPKSMSSIETSA